MLQCQCQWSYVFFLIATGSHTECIPLYCFSFAQKNKHTLNTRIDRVTALPNSSCHCNRFAMGNFIEEVDTQSTNLTHSSKGHSPSVMVREGVMTGILSMVVESCNGLSGIGMGL